MTPEARAALFQLALTQAPAIIEGLKSLFKRKHPDLPVPTDDEVIAAEALAFASGMAKADAWLAAHPRDVENPIGGPG